MSSNISIPYLFFSLKNPGKCPYNGARKDDCPLCHRGIFATSGGTYFSKVRFDVSRMSIIGKYRSNIVMSSAHLNTACLLHNCSHIYNNTCENALPFLGYVVLSYNLEITTISSISHNLKGLDFMCLN